MGSSRILSLHAEEEFQKTILNGKADLAIGILLGLLSERDNSSDNLFQFRLSDYTQQVRKLIQQGLLFRVRYYWVL